MASVRRFCSDRYASSLSLHSQLATPLGVASVRVLPQIASAEQMPNGGPNQIQGCFQGQRRLVFGNDSRPPLSTYEWNDTNATECDACHHHAQSCRRDRVAIALWCEESPSVRRFCSDRYASYLLSPPQPPGRRDATPSAFLTLCVG